MSLAADPRTRAERIRGFTIEEVNGVTFACPPAPALKKYINQFTPAPPVSEWGRPTKVNAVQLELAAALKSRRRFQRDLALMRAKYRELHTILVNAGCSDLIPK